MLCSGLQGRALKASAIVGANIDVHTVVSVRASPNTMFVCCCCFFFERISNGKFT